MTGRPCTIVQSALLHQALELMSVRKVSELPVVDELRHPVGLIDITDVLDQPVGEEQSVESPTRRTA